jgi:demethoxyubiquinone hydroxylase (CLK1/Coq7/Cat5 family)
LWPLVALFTQLDEFSHKNTAKQGMQFSHNYAVTALITAKLNTGCSVVVPPVVAHVI